MASRRHVTLSFSLLCLLSCATTYTRNFKWDTAKVETLLGKIFPTVNEYSSPTDQNIETVDNKTLAHCASVLGKWVKATWTHSSHEDYNVTEVLINLGGYPGQVATTRNESAPEAILIDTDTSERPLPDPPRKNWIYEYNATDYASYLRLEHATKRFSGTPKEFLDIRGQVGWTPANFCGQMLLALYRLDDTGLHIQIRPSAMRFQNNATVLAIRHAPVCLERANGKEVCIPDM